MKNNVMTSVFGGYNNQPFKPATIIKKELFFEKVLKFLVV